MNASPAILEQPPARLVAGALAHLATHMETGCQRSAYLAAMLLEKVASDAAADSHLRRHARQLVEILERDRNESLGAVATDDGPARSRRDAGDSVTRFGACR